MPETSLVRSGDRRLLVFGPNGVVSHSVADGRYTVGRSVEANVRIDDPALSRLHVAIEIEGSTFRISDLGSSNGTRLRGTKLESNKTQTFEIGDLIDVGHSTLVIQTGPTFDQPRRVLSHGQYELRLEEECVRARAIGGEEFAVVRVRTSKIPIQPLESTITTLLAAGDVIARYAPGEYELLLSDADSESVDEAVSALRFGLSRLGGESTVGVACFPRDAQDAAGLSAYAGDAARGFAPRATSPREGETIVVSRSMRRLYELVDRIAQSDISVLVLGETGVGKEILAKTLHEKSKRVDKPFVPLNCGAFTEELLESELFGHERGAFTGAVKHKSGLLETAEGGTVFLDEVGEMSLATQVKLLRVLEERQLRRVGSVKNTLIDVRIVAATNRDLEQQVKIGTFREDLFYRLNGISLVIPPLRERREEIPVFVDVFANKTAAREGRRAPRFSERAMQAMAEYAWPGNVRELKNIVERAVILAGEGTVELDHLPMEKLSSSFIFTPARTMPPELHDPESTGPIVSRPISSLTGLNAPFDSVTVDISANALAMGPNSLKDEVESLERARIVAALEECGGNQSRAAKALGMSRKALLRRLDLYNIPRPRKRQDEED
jgi:two-component system, NtrC family, response regulator AtoC